MKLAVFSDTRQPTKADGGHGLGMSAHSIASGLADRGHDITLCAAWGSEFDSGRLQLVTTESEMTNWYLNQDDIDAVLDTSHFHMLSRWVADAPVVNRIADLECQYQPPNIVVNSYFMQEKYPDAKLINTGIPDPGYFRDDSEGYVLFVRRSAGSQDWLNIKLDMPLKIASGLAGDEKWEMFSAAAVMLHLSSIQAAPRLPVEIGYCGVPTVCLAGDDTEHIVIDGLTGYIAQDISELPELIEMATKLDRSKIYEYMKASHDYDHMIDEYESLLMKVIDGSGI